MAKYILLTNWTEQGIRNVKDSPKRLDSAKALAKKLGGELRKFYMTTGTHDMVVILELPDDNAAATFALTLGTSDARQPKGLASGGKVVLAPSGGRDAAMLVTSADGALAIVRGAELSSVPEGGDAVELPLLLDEGEPVSVSSADGRARSGPRSARTR